MTTSDAEKSKHLLKNLKEQMNFLSSRISQADIVSSNLQGTWAALQVAYESLEQETERH
jgi:hypothetical protein